jgi:hypothetical protein
MVDVDLTANEYQSILNWFYLAFAKLNPEDLRVSDQKLRIKLEIMKEARVEEDSVGEED